MGTDLASQYGILQKKRILRSFEFQLWFPPEIGLMFEPIFASATSFPGREVTDIELPIGGTTVKYPGPPVYNNSWTVTFRDTIDLKIRKALDRWMGPVAFFDPDNVIFQGMYTITVKPENDNTEIYLRNAYISNIGEITMDYSSDAVATYDVSFNYHEWIFN